MGRDGRYSKGRRKITEPVLKVPAGLAVAPRIAEEIREDVEKVAEETVRKLDKNRFVMRKTTGSLAATLVVTILGAAAYLVSTFFTRSHQLDRMHQEMRQIKGALDDAREERQQLERKVVGLETELENVEELHDLYLEPGPE